MTSLVLPRSRMVRRLPSLRLLRDLLSMSATGNGGTVRIMEPTAQYWSVPGSVEGGCWTLGLFSSRRTTWDEGVIRRSSAGGCWI